MYKKMIKQIVIYSCTMTLMLIVIWALRLVASGELVTGIMACVMFGMGLTYWVQTLNDLFIRKSYSLAICSSVLSGWFLYLWFITVKLLQDHLINGTSFPIASENLEGLFGLTGFMGFFIILPIVILFILLAIICIVLIDKWQWRR